MLYLIVSFLLPATIVLLCGGGKDDNKSRVSTVSTKTPVKSKELSSSKRERLMAQQKSKGREQQSASVLEAQRDASMEALVVKKQPEIKEASKEKTATSTEGTKEKATTSVDKKETVDKKPGTTTKETAESPTCAAPSCSARNKSNEWWSVKKQEKSNEKLVEETQLPDTQSDH